MHSDQTCLVFEIFHIIQCRLILCVKSLQGYDKSGDYIVYESPVSKTADDFWTLVTEKNIDVITMLTSNFGKVRIRRMTSLLCFRTSF